MNQLKERVKSFVQENKYKAICISCVVCLLAVSTGFLFLFLNVVTIQDSQFDEKLVISLFSKQNQILTLADTTVSEQDHVLYTSFDGNVKNMSIQRAFDVPITVDGSVITGQITQGTVKDCLQQAGVILGENDFTQPSLHTPLSQGDSVRVYRVEYKDTQYEEIVPYETEYKKSSLTYRFKKRSYVIQTGSAGKNKVTYRERYVDGELEQSLISKVEVVKKPVNEVVLSYGPVAVSPLNGPEGVSIVNNVPSSYKYVISNVSATGYSAARGRGASGLGLFCGSVAVNPNIIPYGSKLYITSPDGQFVYGYAVATDTGTALMDGSVGIDLFYDTYKESSLNWRNVVNIYVL